MKYDPQKLPILLLQLETLANDDLTIVMDHIVEMQHKIHTGEVKVSFELSQVGVDEAIRKAMKGTTLRCILSDGCEEDENIRVIKFESQ